MDEPQTYCVKFIRNTRNYNAGMFARFHRQATEQHLQARPEPAVVLWDPTAGAPTQDWAAAARYPEGQRPEERRRIVIPTGALLLSGSGSGGNVAGNVAALAALERRLTSLEEEVRALRVGQGEHLVEPPAKGPKK